MRKYVKRVSRKAGASPGTLIHVGEKRADKVRIEMIRYSAEKFEEHEIADMAAYPPPPAGGETIPWVHVSGLHDVATISAIGERFAIHALTLEDIVNTAQRPKAEHYPDYTLLVLRMIETDPDTADIREDQVSMVLGNGFLLSFAESQSPLFEEVRERLRKGIGRIRQSGPDYLAYVLMDRIVDNYFLVLENIGETIELVEEDLLAEPDPGTLKQIHKLKQEMIFLRKQVWPLREVVGALSRDVSERFHPSTHIFLRDLHDHCFQVIDTIESFRDILSGMLDLYLSTISNRMNEVMKVLTIIATIFIPLTFIAGLYGMNFRNMPELQWDWGYFLCLALMAAISAGMLLYFRRKKWI